MLQPAVPAIANRARILAKAKRRLMVEMAMVARSPRCSIARMWINHIDESFHNER